MEINKPQALAMGATAAILGVTGTAAVVGLVLLGKLAQPFVEKMMNKDGGIPKEGAQKSEPSNILNSAWLPSNITIPGNAQFAALANAFKGGKSKEGLSAETPQHEVHEVNSNSVKFDVRNLLGFFKDDQELIERAGLDPKEKLMLNDQTVGDHHQLNALYDKLMQAKTNHRQEALQDGGAKAEEAEAKTKEAKLKNRGAKLQHGGAKLQDEVNKLLESSTQGRISADDPGPPPTYDPGVPPEDESKVLDDLLAEFSLPKSEVTEKHEALGTSTVAGMMDSFLDKLANDKFTPENEALSREEDTVPKDDHAKTPLPPLTAKLKDELDELMDEWKPGEKDAVPKEDHAKTTHSPTKQLREELDDFINEMKQAQPKVSKEPQDPLDQLDALDKQADRLINPHLQREPVINPYRQSVFDLAKELGGGESTENLESKKDVKSEEPKQEVKTEPNKQEVKTEPKKEEVKAEPKKEQVKPKEPTLDELMNKLDEPW